MFKFCGLMTNDAADLQKRVEQFKRDSETTGAGTGGRFRRPLKESDAGEASRDRRDESNSRAGILRQRRGRFRGETQAGRREAAQFTEADQRTR